MDWNELARRVRRRGLLRALAEGAAPPSRPHAPPPSPGSHPAGPPSAGPPPPGPPSAGPPPAGPPSAGLGSPPGPAAPLGAPPPPPEVPPADLEATTEIPVDRILAERVAGCTQACPAVVTALADLPAIERGGQVFEVALLRLAVRRPEGDAELCVRQHVPREIRGVLEPGSRVMALAHPTDRSAAIVDWAATADWIGAALTFPASLEQYEWPPREEWPERGRIEIYDVNGLSERLNERRTGWVLASADLVSLTPLRSRVDQRDEWRVALQMPDGHTVQIKDRTPLLALARLQAGDETRVGAPIDVLVSAEGEVAVDWEATLRQPELKRRRR